MERARVRAGSATGDLRLASALGGVCLLLLSGLAHAVAPAAPAGLQVGAGDAQFRHWWLSNTESDLKDYRIWYATFSGTLGTKTTAYAVQADSAYLVDTGGILNGTTYYFQITARNVGLEESPGSTEVSAFASLNGDNTGPGDATGLSATDVPGDQGTALRLSWTASSAGDIKDYRVLRATFSGTLSTKKTLATVVHPGTTHQDVGLAPRTTYYYQFMARDTALNASSASTEASAWPTDETAPAAPTGMGTVDVPSDQGFTLRLSWTANSEPDLKDYAVYRATFPGSLATKAFLTAVAAPGTTHQDAGLTNGATFYYMLTARDTSLNASSQSAEASAVTLDNLAPAAPSGLGVSNTVGGANAGNRLTLSWTTNTEGDLKDYRVYRSTNVGVTQVSSHVVTAVASPGTTRQDAGLGNGTTYYYRLSARDMSLNESGLLAEISGYPSDSLAPNTPAGLAVGGGVGVVNITWSANSEGDMKDYRVYRSTNTGVAMGSSWTAIVAAILAPGTTHRDEALTNETTYYYRLSARDGYANESGLSGEASAIPSLSADTIPPTAPTGLGVMGVVTGQRLNLSWVASTDTGGSGLKEYRVFRSTVSGVTLVSSHVVVVVAQPGTTCQEGGLANGTTYYYRLMARDNAVNESPGTGELSGVPQDTTPPAAPTGLGVTNLGAGVVLNVSWTGNTEADLKDYGVYRTTTTGGVDAAPTRVMSPGTTHQAAGLTNGATYYFHLTARDVSFNESVGSSEVSAYPADVIAPSAPTGLIAAAEAVGGLLDISWGPVTDTDLKDYRVFRGTFSGGQEAAPTRTILSPGTTNQDRGLTNETTYFYRVTARDASLNESGVSNQASALPRDSAPPAVPIGLTVTDPGNVSKLELTWKTNTEVDFKEYRVYRSTAAGGSGEPPRQGVVATISAGNQTLTDTGLVTGATYYYRLTARDFTGNESAGSAEVTGMPSRSVSDVKIAQPDATTTLVVTPPTGEIRVELPPGTFPDPTSVSVMVATGSLPTDANPPPGVALRTLPIAISITAGTRLQPARPVLLSVSYRDQDLPQDAKAERLKIARYDDNRRRWIVLDDSSVNTAKRQVKATTTHFSLFALVELVPASDLSKVVIYPNPWQPGSKGAYDRAAVIVSGLVPQARVRIYTLTGRFIRELAPADASGTTLWDGANDSGEMVASGTYFVLADAPGQAVVRKRVAVER